MHTIAIIDAGGRGAALAKAYAKSPHVAKIFAIPGNDFTKQIIDKPLQIFPHLKTTDVQEIVRLCKKEHVSLVDVAQDNAVAAGLVDALEKEGITAFGPTQSAGRIEWDKAWAREFGQRHGLPQPSYKVCHSEKEGIAFIKNQKNQAWFVKAAGLAEGKGVLPAKNNLDAIEKIKEMTKFGSSGETFVLESALYGEEFSLFMYSDGKCYKIIGSAQDHKRVNNYDEGPNTGGMGCSTPPLLITDEFLRKVKTAIIDKAIAGMRGEGFPYKGVLYLGGMAVRENNQLKPYVIEFNARWGDPEAQAIIPGIQNDFFEIGMAITKGNLSEIDIKTDGKSRIVIAGTSRGYPGNYDVVKGKQIFGLDEAQSITGVTMYGAGIQIKERKYYANGGRLFYIVGEGGNIIQARAKAYQAMAMISIAENNLHYRTDIGWRDVERLRQ